MSSMNDLAGTPSSFTFTGRIRSITHAIRGLRLMLLTQHNAWLHAIATMGVIVLGFVLGITAGEWSWIVLSLMAVWTSEALNTAFEFLCDVASPQFHPLVKNAKDVAAAGVLISAIGSTVIAVLVFGPRIW